MQKKIAPGQMARIKEKVENCHTWKQPPYRRSWHEFDGKVHPPIKESDIPGFGKWLFLNGFRDPLHSHDGFDFSAWAREDGKIMLGLPRGTSVYSLLAGKVVAVGSWVESKDKTEVKYHTHIEIIHNCLGTMATAVSHIVPLVRPGDYVEEGQKIGCVYSRSGEERGYLVHLHVELRALWPGSYPPLTDGPRDPLEVICPDSFREFERLILPSEGPFKKAELEKAGIHAEYNTIDYIQKKE